MIPLFLLSFFFGFFDMLAMAFLTALCHELSHLLAALLLKEKCISAAVMPYGAKLLIKPSSSLKNELLITAAGPLFNALVLIIFKSGPFYEMNLSMLSVNLLPILPLDGGRMLYLILSLKNPFFALSFMKRLSAVCGIFLLPLGAYQAAVTGFNFSIFIIGAFLFVSALDKKDLPKLYIDCTQSPLKKLSEPVAVSELAAYKTVPARALLSKLPPFRYSFINVLNSDGTLYKRISESELIEAVRGKGATINLSEIGKNG